MDENTKVTFRLSIGYNFIGADKKDTFTLKQLGYDKEIDTNIDEFLDEAWKDWSNEIIDGGWDIEE